MTKKINRKQKWRNTTLNKTNIDEYLQDLYNDTAGNYITQGVSFNKDDSFQMTLLRNALIAHGSFSGLIKNLLHNHFEQNGELDDTIWQPKDITDIEDAESEELGDNTHLSPSPSLVASDTVENEPTTSSVVDNNKKNDEPKVTEEEKPKPKPIRTPVRQQQATASSNVVTSADRLGSYDV